MKTKQVMKMNVHGAKFSVTFKEGTNINPYTLYRYEWGIDKNGYPVEHKKKIDSYQNFESCLYHLTEMRVPQFKADYWKRGN